MHLIFTAFHRFSMCLKIFTCVHLTTWRTRNLHQVMHAIKTPLLQYYYPIQTSKYMCVITISFTSFRFYWIYIRFEHKSILKYLQFLLTCTLLLNYLRIFFIFPQQFSYYPWIVFHCNSVSNACIFHFIFLVVITVVCATIFLKFRVHDIYEIRFKLLSSIEESTLNKYLRVFAWYKI